jgi:hypothetical protein
MWYVFDTYFICGTYKSAKCILFCSESALTRHRLNYQSFFLNSFFACLTRSQGTSLKHRFVVLGLNLNSQARTETTRLKPIGSQMAFVCANDLTHRVTHFVHIHSMIKHFHFDVEWFTVHWHSMYIVCSTVTKYFPIFSDSHVYFKEINMS